MWYNRPGPKVYCLFSDAPNYPTAIIELINKNYKNIKNDNIHKSEAQQKSEHLQTFREAAY